MNIQFGHHVSNARGRASSWLPRDASVAVHRVSSLNGFASFCYFAANRPQALLTSLGDVPPTCGTDAFASVHILAGAFVCPSRVKEKKKELTERRERGDRIDAKGGGWWSREGAAFRTRRHYRKKSRAALARRTLSFGRCASPTAILRSQRPPPVFAEGKRESCRGGTARKNCRACAEEAATRLADDARGDSLKWVN